MKTQKMRFYIYPDGPADTMGQSEFVLVKDRLGCTNATFVGDLVKGDVMPDLSSGFSDPIMIEIVKNGEILVSVGYYDGENCIREAVVPLMDMDEL